MTSRSRVPPLAPAGFTMVELLVVISLLALLLGMAALNFGKFFGAADAAKTQARIAGLQSLLATYKTHMGDYPPSRLDQIDPPVRSGDPTYEGIEALVVALTHKDYAYDGPDEEWLTNADSDQGEPNVTRFGKADLFEVVDAWDNPIVYMRYDDYERECPYVFINQETMLPEDQMVKAAVSDKTGTFYDATSYQLRSAGPDGVLGNEDDITSYDM